MRKTISILAILVIASSVFGWALVEWKRPFGNQSGNRVSGTSADTLLLPLSLVGGAQWVTFHVYADSVDDSLPSLVCRLTFKTPGKTWTSTTFATHDAGDTVIPLSTWVIDTITTQTVLLKHYATLWSKYGDSVRFIATGKGEYQSAKNCSLKVRVLK